jgi:phosphatidylinositol glycan class A protein
MAPPLPTAPSPSSVSHPLPLPLHRHRPLRRRRFRVAFVCDFFYPRMGGVEMHIWSLAQCLLRRGHKVVVITHAYDGRVGVRYMTNGLKVYYLPMMILADQCTVPLVYGLFPMFRDVVVRERIEVVHGHQPTSSMTHEALLHAGTMGLRVCYTDHSLFPFTDIASVNVNKLMRFTMSGLDHAIGVSHICRENLVMRARLPPGDVSTIPNAVDPTRFTPDPNARSRDGRVNVVIMSRLVYRKGIDLVARIIPVLCARFPQIHFIVGGDGSKALMLEEMRERYELQDRVEMLGAVPHAKVRDVLVRGNIFLNSSLTESFCIGAFGGGGGRGQAGG